MDTPEAPIEPAKSQTEAAPVHASRPLSVTILALGVLIITVINLVRLGLSIREWEFLASLPGVSPLYIAVTGFIWALAGAVLLWGLWKGLPWASRLMQAVALTYALYYWLDMVFMETHAVSGAAGAILLPVNWPFAAGVTVVSLAYTAWTLSRRKVKAYFGQAESEPSQTQTPGDAGG